MFIGEYFHTIDAKGRVIIPSKFREALGEKFIITKGLDHCLFVYPQDEWKSIEKKLRELPLTSKDARAFVRFFFSGATECELDKQGRIIIPPNLRIHGKMDKEIVSIGVSTRVEIWSGEQWQIYNKTADLSYDDIAEKMVELGI
ncbi:division/cell wall cluster transcriptional repressor MraZ [Marinisporobacter balticus]|uniref:Transcriptional regulator MraZ n=1 Tax=Marinisporobacter balticus TaxID=2018667 RepID=A0A4R2LIY5_9FIRM|nr:division/cell wall cluster transcriptional repressor MraZ [Marinisporobacter balticus]TCO79315.1 MraZ protein [Marinisporobacter balticus]